MKKTILILAAFLVWTQTISQDCRHSFSGQIIDKGSKSPLEYSNIYIEELETGVIANTKGYFMIEDLCKGSYHIRVSHIGCETNHLYLNLLNDTTVVISLAHHTELLNEVLIHDSQDDESAEISNTITSNLINQQSNKTFSEILENISGVRTLKNGSGITKPVVHGLYGNRISVINNGIAQAGQRWGDDHAPEIDPNVADHISVIKGVGSLQYGGNLGSVLLLEPGNIPKDDHIHGRVSYNYQTNGRGHVLHTKLEKSGKWFDWRITATAKQIGDRQTPDYFLTNSGTKEKNVALQLDRLIKSNWSIGTYYSFFSTELGILTGSHVGNEGDLKDALQRSEPLFTSESFSYDINAPKQKVAHHLLKLSSKYFFNENQYLDIKYGGQLNRRKEFDIRRSNRTSIAALNIDLYSHFIEVVYNSTNESGINYNTGLQFNFSDNTNQASSGVLPFIPDYQQINPALFFSAKKQVREKVFLEVGSRFEFKKIDVATINRMTLPRRVERFNHDFYNYSVLLGSKFDLTPTFSSNFNVGVILRSPEVNELHSNGLHQGAARIEYGNPSLNQEQSFKFIWSNNWFIDEKLYIESTLYHQIIRDYIYLKPSINEIEASIRGSFPVFRYTQTDANISGVDLVIKYEPENQIEWTNKISIIRGRDTNLDSVLINIPSNNIQSELTYIFKNKKRLTNTKVSLSGSYVFENAIDDNQDIVPAPNGYSTFSLKAETRLQYAKSSLGISINVENIFNTKYRDYLNQLRYFADDVGRNISINLNYSF